MGATDVLLLAQDVIDRDLNRCLLVAQELVGDRAVPYPLGAVVASAITAGCAEIEVGADDESKRCRVGAVEHCTPSVHIAVSRVLH